MHCPCLPTAGHLGVSTCHRRLRYLAVSLCSGLLVWLGRPPSVANYRVLRPFRDGYAVFLLHLHEVVLGLPQCLGGLGQTVAGPIERLRRHVDGPFSRIDLVGTVELLTDGRYFVITT